MYDNTCIVLVDVRQWVAVYKLCQSLCVCVSVMCSCVQGMAHVWSRPPSSVAGSRPVSGSDISRRQEPRTPVSPCTDTVELLFYSGLCEMIEITSIKVFQTTSLCTIQPLKLGQLTNKDMYFLLSQAKGLRVIQFRVIVTTVHIVHVPM